MGCSLDDEIRASTTSRWTGSEIAQDEDIPCRECGGTYYHAFDCVDDPYPKRKGQAKWSLTVPKKIVVCQTCFAENGHRATCPTRASNKICSLCGMYDNESHTDRMCLIRQSTKRLMDTYTEFPCKSCGGLTIHSWPCSHIIPASLQPMKVN